MPNQFPRHKLLLVRVEFDFAEKTSGASTQKQPPGQKQWLKIAIKLRASRLVIIVT